MSEDYRLWLSQALRIVQIIYDRYMVEVEKRIPLRYVNRWLP